MLKLVIAPKSALGCYISREFFFIIETLEQRFSWRHLESCELAYDSRSLRTIFLDKLGEIPDVILFWEQFDTFVHRGRELCRLESQIGVWVDDIHSFNEAVRLNRAAAFVVADKILATYANRFDEFYPYIRKGSNLVWLPHAASADFVLPLNMHPEPAVFLSGAMTSHYPMRRQMQALYEKGRLPIVLFEHPGYHCEYEHGNDDRIGSCYAKRVGRHLAAFTDGLIYGYLVAKFFEIPATGYLLLAEKKMADALASQGFTEGVHYISIAPESLAQSIEQTLDGRNREAIDKIRRQGQQLILERHLVEHRAQQIDDLFQ
jgi:Glycosyl transferases group 1